MSNSCNFSVLPHLKDVGCNNLEYFFGSSFDSILTGITDQATDFEFPIRPLLANFEQKVNIFIFLCESILMKFEITHINTDSWWSCSMQWILWHDYCEHANFDAITRQMWFIFDKLSSVSHSSNNRIILLYFTFTVEHKTFSWRITRDLRIWGSEWLDEICGGEH